MTKQMILNPSHSSKTEVVYRATDTGYDLTINDTEHSVQFDLTSTVRQGDRVSGSGVLRHQNKVTQCFWLREDTRLDLWIEGKIYHLEVPDNTPKRGNTQGGGAVSGDVKSPMPGTVLQVVVAEGDTVNAGDALIIMESMKMEMTLSAPADGVVKSIHCKASELTELGQLLIALDLKPVEE